MSRAQLAAAARAFGLHFADSAFDPLPQPLLDEPDDIDRRTSDGLESFTTAGLIGLSAVPGGRPEAAVFEPLAWAGDFDEDVFLNAVERQTAALERDLDWRCSYKGAIGNSSFRVLPAPNGLVEQSLRLPGATRLFIVAPEKHLAQIGAFGHAWA